MATITNSPTENFTWTEPENKGTYKIMKAKHSDGFLSLQLPPSKLCFDVIDPTSAYAPKMKLRVTGDLVDWLTQLDQQATASIEDHVSVCPYSPCLKQTAYGPQIEVKPMDGTNVWVYDEGRHKRRGTLADLKRVATGGQQGVAHQRALGGPL